MFSAATKSRQQDLYNAFVEAIPPLGMFLQIVKSDLWLLDKAGGS